MFSNYLKLLLSISNLVFRQLLFEFVLSIRWIFHLISPLKTNPKTSSETRVILSMTTYPKRMKFAYKALKSVILQNKACLEIFVFVFEDEYPEVTRHLSKLSKHGVQVVPFPQNLKQYLKILPALHRFKDCAIITFDDDIIYPKGWLDGLLSAYATNPDYQSGYRGQKVPRRDGLNPENYFTLDLFTSLVERELAPEEILFTGVSGVIYPPNLFCPLVLNVEAAMKLSPNNDDLWLYFNSIHSSVRKLFIPSNMGDPLYFIGSQKVALWKSNDAGQMRNRDALINLSTSFSKLNCAAQHL